MKTKTEKTKPERSAFEAAVDLLSRRDHAGAELRDKLRRKGFTPDDIAEALPRLRELNYLNDERFALAAAKERMAKRRGRRDVLHYLLQKGVSEETARHALSLLDDESDEESLAFEAALRKLSALREPDARKRKEKLARHLLSRGFDAELVQAVVTKAEKHHAPDQSRDS